jgi:hypothetical protein
LNSNNQIILHNNNNFESDYQNNCVKHTHKISLSAFFKEYDNTRKMRLKEKEKEFDEINKKFEVKESYNNNSNPFSYDPRHSLFSFTPYSSYMNEGNIGTSNMDILSLHSNSLNSLYLNRNKDFLNTINSGFPSSTGISSPHPEVFFY